MLNVTRITITSALLLLTGSLATYGHESNRGAPRVFASLVDPADYPDSSHAWPVGEPITVECWGNQADRLHTRTFLREQRARDRVSAAVDMARLVCRTRRFPATYHSSHRMPRRVNWSRLKPHGIRPTRNSNVYAAEWDDAIERSTNRILQDGPARLGVITIRNQQRDALQLGDAYQPSQRAHVPQRRRECFHVTTRFLKIR